MRVPDGWITLTLGEMTSKIGSGSTPRGGEKVYVSSGIPLIRSMNVHFEGFKYDGLAFLREADAEKLKNVEVLPNDVLLNITGASIGRTTLAPEEMKGARVNQHVAIIRLVQPINPGFVRYFLSTPFLQDLISETESGVTRQALTKTKIENFAIPLPPVEEQERIARKLDFLIDSINSCRARIEYIPFLLKSLRESVLQDAVNGNLTKDWRVKRDSSFDEWNESTVDNLVERIEAGLNVRCEERPPSPQEKGLVKISAVTWGRFDENESKTLPQHSKVKESNRIKKGDLLFSRANTLELVGACVIVEDITKQLYLSDKVLRLVTNNDLKAWLHLYLSSPMGRAQIEKLASGNQKSMRNISQANLKSIKLPMPPKAEIDEISRKVYSILNILDQLEARIQRALSLLDGLVPSILTKAFQGHLQTNCDSDEPAKFIQKEVSKNMGLVTQSSRRKGMPKSKKQSSDFESSKSILEILKNYTDALSPDELFELSGRNPNNVDDVEAYYVELRKLVNSNLVEELRPNETDVRLRARK